MVLALVVFANGWGTFHTDIKPEVYLAPGRMLRRYLSAWTYSPYLGSPNFNVGLAPVLLLVAALRELGLSAELTFKVFHFALWLLGAWGASRLLRDLIPGASRVAGLVAGVVFLANPYTVTAGATLAIALPLCLLPWQLLCLNRALRDLRSWAWPAGFGLTFFAMSGMNVAVVPVFQLLAVIPLTLVVRSLTALRWVQVATVLGKCAAFVVLLSLYWLVPSLAAIATGSSIVGSSETLEGIASVSSFPEVLRGLGQWSLYGRDADGPWVPEHQAYLVNPVVVLLTLLLPALALVALAYAPRPLSRLSAGWAALAAVVMVGLHPVQHPSPFGSALRWLFENVAPLSAFRTTNKIGSVLVVAFAMLLGWGALQLAARTAARPVLRPLLVQLAVVMVVGLSLPALTGRLYISDLTVPSYWQQAARVVDERDEGTRVLLLPGQTRSDYTWSEERPDDLTNSLLARDAVIPETTPNTSAAGANLLAALDDAVQSGTSPPATTSTFARYLGVGDVLVRHDVRWTEYAGAHPELVSGVLRRDPGLRLVDTFGAQGENVEPGPGAAGSSGSPLPPLQLYGVQDAVPTVRAAAAGRTLVVDGDGWAVPAMVRAGLLEDVPPFRYASSLTRAQFAALLGGEHRMVLTDTNARRSLSSNRLTNGQGALLPADEPSGPTRALGDDAALQTVLRTEGVEVSASQEGAAFYTVPYGVAANAVDGDPASSWLFGDFRRGTGARLTMTLPAPRTLEKVTVTQARVGSVRIHRVTVAAGGVSRTATLPAQGRKVFDFGGVRAREVTLRVDSLTGEGYNLVGISEVELGGAVSRRIARAPLGIAQLATGLDEEGRTALSDTPLDVLFTRVRGTPAGGDDAERRLDRDFALPDRRQFRIEGEVRGTGPPDTARRGVAGGEGSRAGRCMVVARLDGRPVRMRPVLGGAGRSPDGAGAWRGCHGVTLSPGEHRLRAVDGVIVDSFDLRDSRHTAPPAPSTAPPVLQVRRADDGSLRITGGPTDRPYLLTTGQGYDERWRATVDGEPLGSPVVVDGYSTAWLVDEPGEHEVRVWFGPQSGATVALAVSGITLLVALAVIGVGVVRARGAGPRTPAAVAALSGRSRVEGRPPGPARARVPGWIGAVLLMGAAGLFLGAVGVVLVGVVLGWRRVRGLSGRALCWTGAACVVLSGVAYLVVGGGTVEAAFASGNLVPHYLGGTGLFLGVLGATWRGAAPGDTGGEG